MTTSDATTKKSKAKDRFRLPDPPQREPDEMTQYDHLFKTGNSRYLALHLGNPESTLVEADRWIVADPSFNKSPGSASRSAGGLRRGPGRLRTQQRLRCF